MRRSPWMLLPRWSLRVLRLAGARVVILRGCGRRPSSPSARHLSRRGGMSRASPPWMLAFCPDLLLFLSLRLLSLLPPPPPPPSSLSFHILADTPTNSAASRSPPSCRRAWLWPTIWMLPVDGTDGGWPLNGECAFPLHCSGYFFEGARHVLLRGPRAYARLSVSSDPTPPHPPFTFSSFLTGRGSRVPLPGRTDSPSRGTRQDGGPARKVAGFLEMTRSGGVGRVSSLRGCGAVLAVVVVVLLAAGVDVPTGRYYAGEAAWVESRRHRPGLWIDERRAAGYPTGVSQPLLHPLLLSLLAPLRFHDSFLLVSFSLLALPID
ncbi:hypothetical protein C8J57DRAFT_1725713 [Mycena rebaudengoi]|nr:hypothetical protein C8J57DRAFT_1725713 [Mycena rebaudengoi]